jgi:hypothetical protein
MNKQIVDITTSMETNDNENAKKYALSTVEGIKQKIEIWTLSQCVNYGCCKHAGGWNKDESHSDNIRTGLDDLTMKLETYKSERESTQHL